MTKFIQCQINIFRLRLAGYDHESVMVISYYAAQQKLAKNSIPPAYEVLTVDSAQVTVLVIANATAH